MHAPNPHRRRGLARRLLPMLLPAMLAATVGVASAITTTLPPRDRLTLLVPDAADRASWPVQVWIDSAAEQGIALDVMTDSAFLALGTTAPTRIAGLIVPDSAHVRASDAVVQAVKRYAYLGGRVMLVYDAGAQTEAGYYPMSGSSRFSDFVGLDYVKWNGGAGASTMVGFGPVVGSRSRLESLAIPPGKHLPYTAVTSLAGLSSVAYVPTTSADPGATQAMRDTVRRRGRAIEDGSRNVRRLRFRALRDVLGIGTETAPAVTYQQRTSLLTTASATSTMPALDTVAPASDDVAAIVSADGSTATEKLAYTLPVDSTPRAISGYGYGPLGYFSYVTSGTFPGTVYLASPDHGVVAGRRTYGSGSLLFVNLPLGYFKAIGTDSAPMHGFLGLFAREEVGVLTMSVQPRGRGGLVYNWHIDDGDDLLENTKALLNSTTVLRRGPFSIHLTAGPDVITFGDGNGMDLLNNAQSQDLLRRLGNVGAYAYSLPVQHEIGSHGGWIHDYWGVYANEANSPDLTSLLDANFYAIERVTGRRIREYSAPTGNNPAWAVRWLENRGVVAYYSVGDGGAGAVRPWRDGARLTKALWAIPVTPNGAYATFEEFEEFGVSDQQSGQWLVDLQSFVVNQRTNRMFYNHPPGAAGHLKPVNALLNRGDTLQAKGRFRWYTMAELADFSQRLVQTRWTTSMYGDRLTVTATNPAGLNDVSWVLPKKRFSLPIVTDGRGTLSYDSENWLLTADRGTTITFKTYMD